MSGTTGRWQSYRSNRGPTRRLFDAVVAAAAAICVVVVWQVPASAAPGAGDGKGPKDKKRPTVTVSAPAPSAVAPVQTVLSGSATDNVAVGAVKLSLLRVSTGEFFNGTTWSSTLSTFDANLGTANATSTTWSRDVTLPSASSFVLVATAIDTSNNIAIGLPRFFSTGTPTGVPDLAVTNTSSSTFVQGGTASYLLSVTNVGSSASFGTITLQGELPSALTATSATGTGWTCSLGSTVACTRTVPLAPGATSTVTLNVDIASDAPTTVASTATVTCACDNNLTNNVQKTTVPVTPTTPTGTPDLTIAKTTSSTFTQGGTATYLLTVTNTGNGPTTGSITLRDTMPTGLTATGATGADWGCDFSTTQIACDRTTPIPAGTTTTITINVNIATNAPANITNTATVLCTCETNTANNSGSITVPVTPTPPALPDLAISATTSGSFQRGGSAVYEITIDNIGNERTTGIVTFEDDLPLGLTATDANGDGWACAVGTVVSCSRTNDLVAGASSTISLSVDIAQDAPATIGNDMGVVCQCTEVSTTNNSISVTNTVTVVGTLGTNSLGSAALLMASWWIWSAIDRRRLRVG